jgi:hypothetical protein
MTYWSLSFVASDLIDARRDIAKVGAGAAQASRIYSPPIATVMAKIDLLWEILKST